MAGFFPANFDDLPAKVPQVTDLLTTVEHFEILITKMIYFCLEVYV
jgi:hypothetical protein